LGTLDLTGTITNTATIYPYTTPCRSDLENVIINGGILGGTGTIATAGPNTDSTLNGVTLGTGTKVTAAVGTLDLTGTITNTATSELNTTRGTTDRENVTINGGSLDSN